MPDKFSYSALTYAGAIPFVACAALPWLGVATLGPLGDVYRVLVSYGLAIVCFLCGTQWAAELARPGCARLPLLPISNLLVIATWIAALAAPVALALLTQAAALLVLLAIDGRLRRAGLLGDHYWALRKRITVLVCAALAIAIAAACR